MCSAKATLQRRERVGTTTEQGYDAKWRALSRVYRQRHPTCASPGCGAPSRHVDHRVPIRVAPNLRLEWSNLVALCRPCHSRKTATTDGGFGNERANQPNSAVRSDSQRGGAAPANVL